MAQWYCMMDGEKHGPMTTRVLCSLAREGSLQPTDLIRREDMPDWVKASKAKGLFGNDTSGPGASMTPETIYRKNLAWSPYSTCSMHRIGYNQYACDATVAVAMLSGKSQSGQLAQRILPMARIRGMQFPIN